MTGLGKQSALRRFPTVHLWTFNHPFRAITEQVEFFCSALRDHGYKVSVSNHPSPRKLNVVIENFSRKSAALVKEFCDSQNKRIGVILTEHMDFTDGRLFLHGKPIVQMNDYMHPADKMSRITNLLVLRDRISCLLRLGDLPKLHHFERVMPGISIRSIPYPRLSPAERSLPGQAITYDLAFTGILTAFRRKVLKKISRSHTVYVPKGDGSENLVSRRRRDAINATAKLALNIPQFADWQWLSPMRVLAALRCRRATITLKTQVKTFLDPACLAIDSLDEFDGETVGAALDDYEGCFEDKYQVYSEKLSSSANPEFPYADFDVWARTEL